MEQAQDAVAVADGVAEPARPQIQIKGDRGKELRADPVEFGEELLEQRLEAFDFRWPDVGWQCRRERMSGGESPADRSEERRGGKEGGRTCRSRWAPDH